MVEARDRLSKPVDVAELYTRLCHHRSIGSLRIRADDGPIIFLGTPLRMGAAMVTTGSMGMAATAAQRASGRGGRKGRLGMPGGRRLIGQENTPPLMGSTARRLGRGSRSVLPSWYPRTPLQDITAVVGGAIERRRARLRETEGREIGTPLPLARFVHTPGELTSAAQLEHEFSHTPHPTVGKRHCLPSTVGKVPKILLDITSQNAGEPDFLIPQKKLLNSIDKVAKVVMEELRKMKRTPTAKKAEREKQVRTLMSMR